VRERHVELIVFGYRQSSPSAAAFLDDIVGGFFGNLGKRRDSMILQRQINPPSAMEAAHQKMQNKSGESKN
jgi:hypothetical protein